MADEVIDNFDRADSAVGGVGGVLTDTRNVWEIENNRAKPTFGGTAGDYLLLDKRAKYNDIEVAIDVPDNQNAGLLPIRVQDPPQGSQNYDNFGVYAFPIYNEMRFYKFIGGVTTAQIGGRNGIDFGTSGYHLRLKLQGNQLTASAFQLDRTTPIGTPILYDLANDPDMIAMGPGYYGLSGFGGQTIDALYKVTSSVTPTAVSIAGSGTIDNNSVNTYTVSLNGDITGNVVVNLSASGSAGTLSKTSVTLTTSQPTATFTFTPTATGTATITGSSSGLTSASRSITVTAGSYRLGTTGDSNTEYGYIPNALAAMLSSYTFPARNVVLVNRGASGRTSSSWLPESQGGEANLLSNAINSFVTSGVTVISHALGTNDSKVGIAYSKAIYKANTVATIRAFFEGIPLLEKVVLQYPITPTPSYMPSQGSEWDATSITLLQQYHDALDEIVALPEFAGKVVGSSKGGYSRYTQKPTLLDSLMIHAQAGESAEVGAQAQLQGVVAAFGAVPGYGDDGGSGGDTSISEEDINAIALAVQNKLERAGGTLKVIQSDVEAISVPTALEFVEAMFGADLLTIPGTHTTDGSSLTLTYKQALALQDAVTGGDNTSTAIPTTSGNATVTYYLRGAEKTLSNRVMVSTVTYDANKNQTGRAVKVQNPFPTIS